MASKDLARELRATHFSLGNNSSNNKKNKILIL